MIMTKVYTAEQVCATHWRSLKGYVSVRVGD